MRKETSAALLVLSFAAFAAAPARAQGDPFAAAVAQTKDANPKTRNDGVQALASLPGRKSVAVLEGLLASDADGRVRQSAASALGLQRDASAAPALIAALQDASAPTRFAAIRALAALRSRAAVPALSALLSDKDESMRRTVATELGQIGDPSATTALKGVLSDSSEGVRLEAAAALARLGDSSGLAAAQAGLQSASAHSRAIAAYALAQAGDASTQSALDAAFAAEKDPATKSALQDARARLRQRLNLRKTSSSGASR